MYITKKYMLTIALMGFVVYPAQAVIYQQTPPDETLEGIYSYLISGRVADDFVLSQDSTVNEVTWYGYYNSSDYDSGLSNANFNIDFLSNNPSSPYHTPHSSIGQQPVSAALTDTGYDSTGSVLGRTIYEFTATLSSPVSIGASDKTWLSIFENDNGGWL